MVHIEALWLFAASHVLGIVLSLVASYAIGFSWHGPVFGKQWMAANGIKMPKPEEVKFSMMLPGLTANFFAVTVQSILLGRSFEMLGLTSMGDALVIAVIIWLPFTALNFVNTNAWLGKPAMATLLDIGYYFVVTLAIAAIMFATL